MKKVYPIKTEYGTFKAKIWLDKRDKVYLVEVPSFAGNVTQGDSLADAKYMAGDLIKLLCEEALDEGNIIVDDLRRMFARGKLARHSGAIAVAA